MVDCHTTELNHRIAAGWAKFQSFKSELAGKSYSVKSRLRLFDAVVSTTVLHGSCTWALTTGMAATLDTLRRKMLRFVLRIFRRRSSEDGQLLLEDWPDYMRRSARRIEEYEGLYNLASWSSQARVRKWKFAGELARHGDGRWSRTVLDWFPANGNRHVGRPYTRWCDDILRYAGDDWQTLAQSLEGWEGHGSGYLSSF